MLHCSESESDSLAPAAAPLCQCGGGRRAAGGAAYQCSAAQCITAWHAQLAKEGKALSCPVCRSVWMDALAVGVHNKPQQTCFITSRTIAATCGNWHNRRGERNGRALERESFCRN